jgi:FixJ family two-component response regulator
MSDAEAGVAENPRCFGASRQASMTNRPPRFVVAAIDDDPSVLRSLEYLLDSADYGVRLFTSAAELLESGCLPEIDCLISDVDMPGIDGFELLRRVRADRTGLPVILITGYPDTLTRAPPLDKVFTKPFRAPELLAAVSEAIRRFRQ